MSTKTGIEWTDATWNPVTGCSKVSQGCKHCYAERDWARLSALRVRPTAYTGRAFTDVACHPERLAEPLRWAKPRRIFVNSMSDLFHEDVSDFFLVDVFAVMAAAERHTFQILTKRPARMRELLRNRGFIDEVARKTRFEHGVTWLPLDYFDQLTNVWLGVSVEDQATADERIPLLLDAPAAVRWISAEPLLGPVDVSRWLDDGRNEMALAGTLDWVVVGGESGPHARPMHPGWVRSLRDQCAAAGVPFLFKQWGQWLPLGKDPTALQTESRRHGHTVSCCSWPDGETAIFIGKKAAGRLLDGVLHDGYPQSAA
ncbi:MAG: phage Gp37/Gp68 family protein [Sulfuritalea sp.]|nr:phage Gp37/Gp68 family protein [Sulfuritalea sp.]